MPNDNLKRYRRNNLIAGVIIFAIALIVKGIKYLWITYF